MNMRVIASLMIGLVLCGCGKKGEPGKPVTIEGKKVEFIKFYATWCPPCTKLKPIVDGIKKEYPNVTFYDVDVDTNKKLAQKHKVSSIPVIVIQVDGKVVKTIEGLRDEATLKALLDKYSKN